MSIIHKKNYKYICLIFSVMYPQSMVNKLITNKESPVFDLIGEVFECSQKGYL